MLDSFKWVVYIHCRGKFTRPFFMLQFGNWVSFAFHECMQVLFNVKHQFQHFLTTQLSDCRLTDIIFEFCFQLFKYILNLPMVQAFGADAFDCINNYCYYAVCLQGLRTQVLFSCFYLHSLHQPLYSPCHCRGTMRCHI